MKGTRVALVTGGNRGIGLETCRQLSARGFSVVLSARDLEQAAQATENLLDENPGGVGTVEAIELDITEPADIQRVVKHIDKSHGRLDVLINNAGIFPEQESAINSIIEGDLELIKGTFEVNTIGPIQVTRSVLPIMLRESYGRIVNLSSAMGQLDDMGGNSPGYRLSKAALNAATRIFAAELGEQCPIKINAVSPGWVRTDMGGSEADRSLHEGVQGILFLAMLPQDGPSGRLFRDQEELAW